MQNEIYDEKNGLTYMLCGDYYLPELALTDIEPTYGKYGMLRKSYLQEHRKAKYQILLLQGKLVEHLNQIDAEARDREEQLVKQMMEKQGITEKLKRQDNMEWTRRMNTLCHDAEEIILTEIIYAFLTIFLYLLKCPQSLILSALRAFCFCGKPHISRSIFLYFRYQTWLKSW